MKVFIGVSGDTMTAKELFNKAVEISRLLDTSETESQSASIRSDSEHFRRLAETALLIEQADSTFPEPTAQDIATLPQFNPDTMRFRNPGEEDWNGLTRKHWCMVWKGKVIRWQFSETVDEETQNEIGAVIDAACKPTEVTDDGWNKWPDIKPQIGKFVLIHARRQQGQGSGTYVGFWTTQYDDWVIERAAPDKLTVTHWRPLPLSPQEEATT